MVYAILTSAILLAILVRGLIVDQKRKHMVKLYIKNIVEPMEYIVSLQKEGFFDMLYRLDGNKSYIDNTFGRALSDRKDFISEYGDNYVWKCFLWKIDLDALKDVYDQLLPAYSNLYDKILMREKIVASEMMRNGCRNWEEYLKFKNK